MEQRFAADFLIELQTDLLTAVGRELAAYNFAVGNDHPDDLSGLTFNIHFCGSGFGCRSSKFDEDDARMILQEIRREMRRQGK